MPRPRRPVPPLDPAALERMALRYVERFATTRAKLVRYLDGKIRLRGWADERPADPDALAERMVTLGYIDDRAFAEARAGAMSRRGLGARRVREALRHAGVAEPDTPDLTDATVSAALELARRKRIGPFAETPADPVLREKQLGQLVRAGHGFALARAIVRLEPGDDAAAALVDFGNSTCYATDRAGEC